MERQKGGVEGNCIDWHKVHKEDYSNLRWVLLGEPTLLRRVPFEGIVRHSAVVRSMIVDENKQNP